MITNTSATLFSKSVSKGVEVWTRIVLPAVSWQRAEVAVQSRVNGVIRADRITVFVPLSLGEIAIKPGDYIVKGEVPVAGEGETYSMTTIRQDNEPDVGVVREVSRFDFSSTGIQHLQIGAN